MVEWFKVWAAMQDSSSTDLLKRESCKICGLNQPPNWKGVVGKWQDAMELELLA